MNATATTLTLTKDLLTGTEWNSAQVRELFHLAAEMKAHPNAHRTALAGRSFALIFEKPSLRTRVTFEVGITSLGGSAIFLDHTTNHLGEREPIPDVAKCLERWVSGIVARVFSQQSLEELARHARVPVINALSDRFHPCQAFADFFTLEERFGSLRGLKFAYIGDGNNMCHSLLSIGARAGATFESPRPEAMNRTLRSLPRQNALRVKREGKLKFCGHPKRQSQALKPFIPTSGPAWVKRKRPTPVQLRSPVIRSMKPSCPEPLPTLCSCIAFQRIVDLK